MLAFNETLKKHNIDYLRKPSRVLQINLGKLCNQACLHCHVEAGPKRKEIMEKRTADRVLELLKKTPEIHTIDLTGGAPELNPNFRFLVSEFRKLGKKIIDRCNLTVLFEKGQETTAEFLKSQNVQVVASLPCYQKENVEKQRGHGVFDKSIEALKILNQLGYAQPGSGLELNLVYNPVGAYLPPNQEELEMDYKAELKSLFGIEFNHLYTITNMPIKRFLRDLEREKKLTEYMELLISSFNLKAALGVMCLDQLSVGWDGRLYDCDFNQMLEMPIANRNINIWDIQSFKDFEGFKIATANHCYGCTAGAGSSCGGALI